MATNDAELLERWTTGGDAQAFDSLVTGYSGLVYSACRRILGNDADAQDATQECFLQLAQRTPKIQVSLAAWLHTVATRKAISRVREESRRARREQSYAKDADTTVEADWDDIQDFIDEAIRALPAENRVPVVASFLERKTHADIAKEIGVDRSTVSRRIDRGVEGIRDHLKEKGVIATSATLMTMLTTKMTEAMPIGLAASLAKIALTGGRLQTAGSVAGGGFLASALDFLGGITVGKAVAGVVTLIALLGGAWFVNAQRNSPRPAESLQADASILAEEQRGVVEPKTPMQPSAPETPETTIPVRRVESMEATEDPPATSVIEGRVFDASTKSGFDGITVTAYLDGIKTGPYLESGQLEEPTPPVASAETERGGHFSIPDLPVGAYRLVTQEIEGYPETYDGSKRMYVQIHTPSESAINIDIPLERGGILAGVAILGDGPLPDTDISIVSYSSSNSMLGTLTTRTDSRGRYRIEDLPQFEGSLIAKRTQPNGQRQDALVVPATIRPGEVTEVTFDFISGTATIEGTVYYQNEETPIEASIQVFFGWEDDGTYKEEIIRARTDEMGHYIVEGLPAGNAEIHVTPSNAAGNLKRTETLILAEGQHAVKNIVLSAMALQCQIANVPTGAVQVFLTAHPGEVELEMTDTASFMAIRNTMVTYAQLHPGQETELYGELSGLKPGRYTISASAWPAAYSFAAIQAYGAEKFFEDLRMVSTFITVGESDPLIEVVLDFSAP